jgi:hypothetical protein
MRFLIVGRLLGPVESVSEALFGLITLLTITLGAGLVVGWFGCKLVFGGLALVGVAIALGG